MTFTRKKSLYSRRGPAVSASNFKFNSHLVNDLISSVDLHVVADHGADKWYLPTHWWSRCIWLDFHCYLATFKGKKMVPGNLKNF